MGKRQRVNERERRKQEERKASGGKKCGIIIRDVRDVGVKKGDPLYGTKDCMMGGTSLS